MDRDSQYMMMKILSSARKTALMISWSRRRMFLANPVIPTT